MDDMISGLPDPIILHIFSFLPTKSVFSTSILSKRWRYVCTSTPILDFTQRRSFENPNKTVEDYRLETQRFMNFVNKFLLPSPPPLQHDDEVILPNVKKFSLGCDCLFDGSTVLAWIINLVTRRKIEQLSLSFGINGFVFPHCFFTCETLIMLELESYVLRELPESISFPKLKILRLKYIDFVQNHFTEQLVSNCPVLEELVILHCTWMGGLNSEPCICISAPSLKCLIINGCVACDFGIKIHAPNLLSLTFAKSLFHEYVVPDGFKSIVDANIEFNTMESSPDFAISAKLVAGISNVKLLKVSHWTLEVLSFAACVTKLSEFVYLTHLEVTQELRDSWLLLNFLRITPNLETLVFAKGFVQSISGYGSNWATESIPECLLLSLKVVEFREFYGRHGELQAIKDVLENARALERMTVLSSSTLPTTWKNACMKKLVNFPKGSTSCVVNLS